MPESSSIKYEYNPDSGLYDISIEVRGEWYVISSESTEEIASYNAQLLVAWRLGA